MLEDLTVVSWDRGVAIIPCYFILPGLTTFTPSLLFLALRVYPNIFFTFLTCYTYCFLTALSQQSVSSAVEHNFAQSKSLINVRWRNKWTELLPGWRLHWQLLVCLLLVLTRWAAPMRVPRPTKLFRVPGPWDVLAVPPAEPHPSAAQVLFLHLENCTPCGTSPGACRPAGTCSIIQPDRHLHVTVLSKRPWTPWGVVMCLFISVTAPGSPPTGDD